jgi:hypothetical protein
MGSITVIPVLLVQHRRSSGLRHAMGVVLQSRPPEYGLGRFHPNAALGHGCITVLLSGPMEIGGITYAESNKTE